jgi:hypothetical protein
VRWIDTRDRLCIGRSAPVMLRAPYFGLGADICVTPDTRLKRRGADVEYLAGTETVLVRAADLVSGPAARFERSRPLRRFHHIMLDDPACLHVWRCRVETAFLSEVLASQDGGAGCGAARRQGLRPVPPASRPHGGARADGAGVGGAELRDLTGARSLAVFAEERGHLDHDHRVVVQGPLHQCRVLVGDLLARGLPVGARAVARDIQRREVGLFQNGHRFAHGLGLVDTGGIAQQRRAGRASGRPSPALRPTSTTRV